MNTPFNVLRHVRQWERAPRMPQAVGAAILTQIGATTLAANALVASAVGYLATTAITSWALSALAPDVGGIGGSRGMMVNATDPAAPHDIVYGTVRKGGIRTYVESTGDENKFLHMILVLAGHELAGIDDIYLNDEIVTVNATSGFVTSGNWNSKIRIKKHRGNETVADALLLAESNQINANFVGRGIAYLYIRLEYDQDVFANGIPLITANVRGRKVYDPRNATTAYSANAALVVRDYLTASFGLADSSVDDAMFATSANVSDESIALATAGSEPRYQINGVVSSDMSPREIVSRMTTACGGTLFWGQGKWQLHVGYYSAPVKTFTLDDLRGAISLDTRVGARDNFNRVVGTFADKEVDYITVDFPPIESAAFRAEDNGIENTLDLQLPLTTSESAAQRLAKMTLFRAREQMTFSADFGLEAFSVQVGDIVAFTNTRYGWTAKEFEVVGWRFETSGEGGDLRVNLTLRETSEAAFAWNAEESAIIHNNTNLPSFTAGLTINGLTASGGGKTQKDGTFIASTILSWTAVTNAFISHYEIEWKPTADSNYSSTTTTQNSIEISPIIDAVGYTFRVRAVTTVGNSGPLASVSFTAGGDVTAPSLPTSITAAGGFEYITIRWTRPANADFNYVEVWENASNTTTGATKVGVSAGDEFVRTNLGISQTKWYFLKSVDYSGNKSAFTSGVSGTTTFVDDADFADGIYSLFTDQGLYAIRDVTSLPASGAFTGEKAFNRTDGKLYQWTGSAWVLVIADVADGSITGVKIGIDAVTAPKILAGTITGDKIVANTITGGLIAASGIITSSAQINDAVVTNAKISNLAVDSAKIANTLQSTNYVANTTGWRINKAGSAEFYDIAVRGSIVNTSTFAKSPYSGGWSSYAGSITLNSKFNQLGGAGLYRIFMAGAGGSGTAQYTEWADTAYAKGGSSGAGAYFTLNWNGTDAILFTAGSGGAGVAPTNTNRVRDGNNGGASTFSLGGVVKVTCAGGLGAIASTTAATAGAAAPSSPSDSRISEFSGIAGGAGGATTGGGGASGGGGLAAFSLGSASCRGGNSTGGGAATAGGGPFGQGGDTGATLGASSPATPEDSNGLSIAYNSSGRLFSSSAGYFSGPSGEFNWGDSNIRRDGSGFLAGGGYYAGAGGIARGGNGGLLAGGGGSVATDDSISAPAESGDGGPAGGGGGARARGAIPTSGDGGLGIIFFKKL